MKYAMDVKVNVKPIFSNMVHTDVWEGPCRVGTPDELNPRYEIRAGKEQFEIWKAELEDNLANCANILEPVYIEFDESFSVSEAEFAKIEKDVHEVDIFLITYRVPGLERFGKAISMINLGPTPIDIVAYYRDEGYEAYMAHDYDEYNTLLGYLQVKKAMSNTKMLVLSATEQVPASVNSSNPNLSGLTKRYGIKNNRLPFRAIFDEMDKLDLTVEMEKTAKDLINCSGSCTVKDEWVNQDVKFLYAVRSLMEKYGCNAFTISCKELCASKLPMKYKITPCITHSINNDSRLPSACEEDINLLMAVTVFMYLTKKSVFMGNPVLVPKKTKKIDLLGMPKLLTAPSMYFDEDILEIHHAVPGRKLDGYDKPDMPYDLGHFTVEGFGSKVQVDMANHDEKIVTIGRFNRRGDSIIVAKAEILGCEFRETYCSPAVYYRILDGGEDSARRFRQELAQKSYGHHLAVVYGDYTKEMSELGKIAGFKVEVFGQ